MIDLFRCCARDIPVFSMVTNDESHARKVVVESAVASGRKFCRGQQCAAFVKAGSKSRSYSGLKQCAGNPVKDEAPKALVASLNATHNFQVTFTNMLVTAKLMRTTGDVSLRTLLVTAPLKSGSVVVEGDEAHHGRDVLRLRPGDDIRVADGEGACAQAVVTGVGRHALEVEVASVEHIPDGNANLLSVACAIPKGDRFADLVRGLTELGVGEFIPLTCDHGERVPGNLDRQRRIALEALKQCRRARPLRFGATRDVLTLVSGGAALTVLDPTGHAATPGTARAMTLVIGPEGGFSTNELQALSHAPRARIAATILRIETAAVAAAAVWVSAWEGLSHE